MRKNITSITLAIFFIFSLTTTISASTIVFKEAKCDTRCCKECYKTRIVCEPDYIIVWGKGKKGVTWFLKNHIANSTINLGDVYKIPKENKADTPGLFKIKDGETSLLRSNKKGVTDKYYRFVSFKSAKALGKNSEISIDLPKNMPKGNYFLGVVAINGFSASKPSEIFSFKVK